MLKYIILGIIQGVTEFLPVSSSAHLVLGQKILNITGQELAVSLFLHLGTALALVIFFFKDILNALRNIKLLLYIIIVTVITGIIGIGARDFFEGLFSSIKVVTVALTTTGIILILTKNFMEAKRNVLNIKDAFILGLAQGLAIIPGISRSGITISTLLFRRIDRQTSFRLSFLASIPAVLGATLLEARNIDFALKGNFQGLLVGFIFSFISGILSLWLLKIILRKAKLYYFGYYCIFIALITLLFIK